MPTLLHVAQNYWWKRRTMADLHDDVTYEGWGKSLAAGHRECMGNSKRMFRRSISLLLGKTDRLHALMFATQRVGVFISESDWYCHTVSGVNWLESRQWFGWWCLPLYFFWKMAKTCVLKLLVSHFYILCACIIFLFCAMGRVGRRE